MPTTSSRPTSPPRSTAGRRSANSTSTSSRGPAPTRRFKLRQGDVIPVGKVEVPVDIGRLLDADQPGSAGHPQRQPAHRRRRVLQGRRRSRAGAVSDRRRIDLAGDRGGKVHRFNDGADRPVPARAEVAGADRGLDRDMGEAASGYHRPAQGSRRRVRGPAHSGRPAAWRKAGHCSTGSRPLCRCCWPTWSASATSRSPTAHDIEQLLVLFPQGIAVMAAAIVGRTPAPSRITAASIWTSTSTSTCRRPAPPGFFPPISAAHPSRGRAGPRRADLYCRVPQDSTFNVRGARNIPCETAPGKRAPTSRCAKATSSTCRSTTATTGRATRTPPSAGRACPQYPPGAGPQVAQPSTGQTPPTPGPAPPATGPPLAAAEAAPPPLAVASYDPATGEYIGPDGRRHVQGDLAESHATTWQSMLVPPALR